MRWESLIVQALASEREGASSTSTSKSLRCSLTTPPFNPTIQNVSIQTTTVALLSSSIQIRLRVPVTVVGMSLLVNVLLLGLIR
jgi:hypothetical protein